MIRTAINDCLKELKTSKRKCALENQLTYQNFNSFLNGQRQFPIADIEKVLKYLGLKIKQ